MITSLTLSLLQLSKSIFLSISEKKQPPALFNNLRTLKFRSQPTNAVFASFNQTFGGSSQLTTTAELCFVVRTVLNDLITAPSAVVESWEEPPGHLIGGNKKRICRLIFEFKSSRVIERRSNSSFTSLKARTTLLTCCRFIHRL